MSDELEVKEEQELDNDKVVAYVTKYLQTWNKTDAYMACHPESTRNSAMTNTFRYWNSPKVQAAIRVILDDALIGTDELKAIVSTIARGGNGIKKAEQLKAAELLMKSKGMFLDRLDVTTQGKSLSWEQIISENRVDTKSNFTVLG